MDRLNLEDIDAQIKGKIYLQSYAVGSNIEGVKIIKLENHVGEDGDFSEIMRINDHGRVAELPEFQLKQINRTKLEANSIKAWHIHFKQDEVWYTSPQFSVFAGLWDVRKNSPTRGQTMRVVMGGTNSFLLFIPHGVAHGTANFSQSAIQLYYFVNERFNPKQPDEYRIPWDSVGASFWQPARD